MWEEVGKRQPGKNPVSVVKKKMARCCSCVALGTE